MADYYLGSFGGIAFQGPVEPPNSAPIGDISEVTWLTRPPDEFISVIETILAREEDLATAKISSEWSAERPTGFTCISGHHSLIDAIRGRELILGSSDYEPEWISVGVGPGSTPDNNELRLIIDLLITDVASLVRDLDIGNDAKREVVDALDEWGEAISSLPTIQDPEALGETAAAASGFARTAIEKAGPGAALVGRALWALSKHPLVYLPLSAALVEWTTGMPDIVINLGSEFGPGE